MRPPILFLAIAFGVGLWGGLGPSPGRGAWYVVAPLLVAATLLHRRAPPGAAGGIMVVAGKWSGLLVVRRVRALDPMPRGRGALRDALAARSTELFGAQAPIVNALVFAPNARLDSDIRERYVRSGLAHLLSISGLHVGFIAAWLTLILGKLHLTARARFGATAVILLGYLWLLAFRTVAPIGVLANLIAIPLAGVAVPGLVMALGLSWLGSGLAHLIAAGAGLGLALLDLVARSAALVPGGHVVMVAGWQAALIWTAVAAVAWWLWNSPRRPWLIAARVALVTTVLVATTFRDVVTLDACRCLTVFFLDVGQGDAAALRTPNGRWIVIDGGPRTPAGDAGRRVVVPFLRSQGVGRVAVVVATHGDADHLGGLPAVVEAFDPELVLEPGEPLGRPLYLEFLAGVEASGARWHAARAGDRIEVDGVVLEVLSPDSLWLRLPLDVNEHGVVLRVRYGGVRLLFQADAGLPVEGRLTGTVGPVDLLKVGHHGSRTATSEEWVRERAPPPGGVNAGGADKQRPPGPPRAPRAPRDP